MSHLWMDLFSQQINLNKLKVNALYMIFIHDRVFNHIVDLKLFHKFAKVLLIWKYVTYLMTRIWYLEQVMFHEMNVNKLYFWIFDTFEERKERKQLKFKYITSFHTIVYLEKTLHFLGWMLKMAWFCFQKHNKNYVLTSHMAMSKPSFK